MAQMGVNGAGAAAPGAPGAAARPPPPQAPPQGPARAKRAARAYHQDATGPASTGWNDVMAQPPPPQASWQQQAAARAAAFEAQRAQQGGAAAPGMGAPQGMPPPAAGAPPTGPGLASQDELDSALDAMPVHRNVISPTHLASNRASMSQQQGGIAPHGVSSVHGAPGGGMQRNATGAAKPRIDPDQIPSPVEAQYADQQFFNHEFFNTCSREGLPLSTTDFAAVDQGNCSPKFMRLTTYCVPTTDEVATSSQLPIALTVQPFAQQRPDEMPVPVTDPGEQGPPRCKRCRAYINPWCLFVEGGMKWVCNMCGTATDVSQEYFCNLDMSGRRVDLASRPELTHGVVDFVVPREYWAMQATPPAALAQPAEPAFLLGDSESVSTTTKLQENVDKITDNAMEYANNTEDTTESGAAKVAAKAAKAASDAALGTLHIGKGQTRVRVPRPLTYLFAIDVSFSAVRCGAVHACAEAIRQALYGTGDATPEGEAPGFGLPPGSRVGIMTFDSALHFYNLDASLEQAQMLVVGDVDEPFIPISDGLLVDPWASRHVIEALLRDLPSVFEQTSASEAAFGAAVRGAQAALTTIGGQLNMFLSTIPTLGPGRLKHREDTKLYGTENEKNLFAPQDVFYRVVGEELALAGVGVNVFFFPNQYTDLATISHMTNETGGEIFFHPRFDPVRDAERVRTEVLRTVLRETASNVSMRVRCSNGLRIAKHYGAFHQHSVTDLEAGTWDADKSVTVLIKHDGRLEESHEAFFQCAALYTSAIGERRVRVITLAVPVTSTLGNVFRYADLDSTVSFFAKEAVMLAHGKALKDVRGYLTGKCVRILLAYRRHCASSTSPGQLILPESFKLLPLYMLALIKNKAIKGGNVTSDVRVFFMQLLQRLSVGATLVLLYPRMIALHTLADTDGFPVAETQTGQGPDGQVASYELMKRIQCPRTVRPSYQRMDPHGAYLLENGEWCLLWLGAQVSPKLLEDLYGVSSLDELDPRMTSLPKLPTRLSQQARNLVASFAQQRCKSTLQVILARQNRDGMEVELANNLVEDQNNDAMSYVDYLCHVHRVISTDMSSGRDERSSTSLWKGFS